MLNDTASDLVPTGVVDDDHKIVLLLFRLHVLPTVSNFQEESAQLAEKVCSLMILRGNFPKGI